MPPKAGGKKKAAAAQKKAEDKRRDRVIEDKTFGLKNKKKSKTVQKYIAAVTSAVQQGGRQKPHEQRKEEEAKKKKKAEAAQKAELAALLKAAIVQPKLAAGVDPKSVVCEYFKRGLCAKGKKCKFSHDLTVTRKSAKKDLHTDLRDDQKEGMEDWDQSKLEEVVRTKHSSEGNALRTEIVCKYFLDAIEKEVYGWFWVCPNGGNKCKYRHALPPGYVFKSKKQRELEEAAAEQEDETTIEEAIEAERAALPREGLTPVTHESFMKWKADREVKKAALLEARRLEEAKKTGGRGLNVLSGRALFTFDPTLFVDDDGAASDDEYDVVDIDEHRASAEGPAAGAGGSAEAAVPADSAASAASASVAPAAAGAAAGAAAPAAAVSEDGASTGGASSSAASASAADSGKGKKGKKSKKKDDKKDSSAVAVARAGAAAASAPSPAPAPAPAAASGDGDGSAVSGLASAMNADLFLGDDDDDLPSDDDDDDDDDDDEEEE